MPNDSAVLPSLFVGQYLNTYKELVTNGKFLPGYEHMAWNMENEMTNEWDTINIEMIEIISFSLDSSSNLRWLKEFAKIKLRRVNFDLGMR